MISSLEFESIVRASRPQLVRFLGRLVGDTDAEDVVQIVLTKAHSSIAEFRGDASPRTWLFRIATNAAHDWNRARRPSKVETIDPLEENEGAIESSDDPSQERQLVREQMSQCVNSVFNRLPESYQVVLALSDCEDLSDREVAEAINATVGSAKIRLHRARARLKEELERCCSFYRDADNTLRCDHKE
jgi:RNA polymerase sigma-70 factor, ECF subfamily